MSEELPDVVSLVGGEQDYLIALLLRKIPNLDLLREGGRRHGRGGIGWELGEPSGEADQHGDLMHRVLLARSVRATPNRAELDYATLDPRSVGFAGQASDG